MDESIKACPESVFCGGRTRSNIILYCRHFEKTVSFYQEVLGLAVHHRKVWLVEFRLSGDAFVSVADARRASIESASGAGVTLSLAVGAIDEAHARLRQKKISLSAITTVWGARAFYLYDPEGHRIELWQQEPQMGEV